MNPVLLSSWQLLGRLSRPSAANAIITVPKRTYVKFDSDRSSTLAPYVVKIPHINCYIRNASGKVATKAFRAAEQIPSYVDGLQRPTTLLTVDLARLNHMYNGGVLYDDKRVLLLIHNKDNKLVETTVATVKGLLNHRDTEHVIRLWFNRLDLPVERNVFVDLSGEKFQDVDYYQPGGMSDDHQAFVNARWRKVKDDWWMGVEQKIPAFDPNFQPTNRGPKAPKQARKKK